MIERSKSLSGVPTVIFLLKVASCAVLIVGIIASYNSISVANQAYLRSNFSQDAAVLSNTAFFAAATTTALWLIATLLIYSLAVVIQLLSQIEENNRATASYIYFQINKQYKERPKIDKQPE